jgi:hypothetical protein
VVEGRDCRVCAVPLRFGCEPEDDDARDQAAKADDDRQHPGPGGVGDRLGALAERRRRYISGEPEEELRREVQRHEEQRCAEAANDADHCAKDDPLAQVRGRADADPEHPKQEIASPPKVHANGSKAWASRARITDSPGEMEAAAITWAMSLPRSASTRARKSLPASVRRTQTTRLSNSPLSVDTKPRRFSRETTRLAGEA